MYRRHVLPLLSGGLYDAVLEELPRLDDEGRILFLVASSQPLLIWSSEKFCGNCFSSGCGHVHSCKHRDTEICQWTQGLPQRDIMIETNFYVFVTLIRGSHFLLPS